MSQLLLEVQHDVARHMDEILSHFKPGALITVLVRTPGNDRADFCMTSDTIDDAIALLARRKVAAANEENNDAGQ
ncbi:hypothetical protein SAMN05892877_11013 [Rhizobium subbaraonis]|uniref:Uncharacterized protein n=1 Tax=Rhizobium subbaraonis TaxID=908946 RepID=A0A285UQD8_9HYPH|nr:hypothetical protein [Rhizobium subbaraonis]SOC42471.1 hypothetical protein SAMN05892877_11013 [Rhizobium subbaraonis]